MTAPGQDRPKYQRDTTRLGATERPAFWWLAAQDCSFCCGSGRRERATCRCVWRGLFDRCLETVASAPPDSPTHIEYAADLQITARRVLTTAEYEIFQYYFLRREGWRYCAARSRLDKAAFFPAAYRVREMLGHAFSEFLCPDRYFAGYHRELRTGQIDAFGSIVDSTGRVRPRVNPSL